MTNANRRQRLTLCILGLAFFAAACADEPEEASSSTSIVAPDTTVAPPTTAASTTTVVSTTTTGPVANLIDPLAGTLAGVPVGSGPVDPMITTLEDAYGPVEQDTGWGPNDCDAALTHRYVIWESLAVYLEEAEGAQVLLGYVVEVDPGTTTDTLPEVIELPDGIALGMTYGEAADLYPDDVYTHESLELDGILFPAPHTLAVIAQASPDRSTPITEAWVGSIPACS